MLSIAQYSNNNKLQQIDHFIQRLHCGLADKKERLLWRHWDILYYCIFRRISRHWNYGYFTSR